MDRDDLLAGMATAAAEFGLTWLCQSTALLGMGLVAGRVLRRHGPAVQSAVYRTALAAVLVCPAASALLDRAGVGGLTLRLTAREADAVIPAPAIAIAARTAPAGPILSESPPTIAAIRPAPTPAPVVASPSAFAEPAASPPQATPDEATVRPVSRPGWFPTMVGIGLVAWALGTGLIGVRMAVATRRLGRLRAGAISAGPEAEALCRDLAGRMGLAAPRVLRSPYLAGPCVDGLFRPAILLPEDDGADLRATLVHELAHLARRDGLWNLLRHAASGVLWFQPLLWALSRRIEVTAEEVCDDHVVQFGADRARYAGLLVELAGRALPPLSPTGVGMVSLRSLLARRVVRILDSSRVLSIRAGSRAVAMTVFAGLVGTLLAGLLAVGGRERQARADGPGDGAPAAESGTETVSGRVVGPDDRPIPAAVVTTIAARNHLVSNSPESKEIARTIADADGRFTLTYRGPEIGPDGRAPWEARIYAQAPGYGLSRTLDGKMMRLVPDDVPVIGRLVDLQGRPVSGASVRVVELTMPKPGAERPAGPAPAWFDGSKGLGFGDAPKILMPTATTDADGRFRIDGLGRGRLAKLKLSGPDMAVMHAQVVTRTMDRIANPAGEPGNRVSGDSIQYGANCVIAVEPTRPIEGFVRDVQTGEPIPDAIVNVFQPLLPGFYFISEIESRTDARGRYRLVGLTKDDRPNLSVTPPLDRPYFQTGSIEVPATPGSEPVACDIPLRRGVWLTGRVTDARTSAPLAASVVYDPSLGNPDAKGYANFRPDVETLLGISTRHRTDRDGRFRVVGIPGFGVVAARADDRAYRVGVGAESILGRDLSGRLLTYGHLDSQMVNAVREIAVPKGAEGFTCDLALDPGGSVVVRLADEAGRPIPDVEADGRFPSRDEGDRNLHRETTARVVGLDPGKSRTVVFKHEGRGLGAVVEIPPDGPRDGREMTVVLRPNFTVAGRLVDAKGGPAGGDVSIRTVQAGGTWNSLGKTIARMPLEADGRFRVGAPPGGTYIVEALSRIPRNPDRPPVRARLVRMADHLAPQPGAVVDLGTFDATTGKRVAAPVPAEAPRPAPADVPITGRILDLEGRPIAGVSVTTGEYQTMKGGDLTPWLDGVGQGQPPWIAVRMVDWHAEVPEAARRGATTDADGRFRIDGLGAEAVVDLTLGGEAIAQSVIRVATRRMAPVPAPGFANHHGRGRSPSMGPTSPTPQPRAGRSRGP